ncbi:MAG: hypothetical protein PHE21_00035 [Candidatus Dojkabacteria bacterium]|nr:hypothetical protein [Candidatus Dojkabacteria bacterium]
MSIKAGNGSTGGNYLSQTYLGGNPVLSQEYTESFSDGIGLTDSHVFFPMKVFADAVGLTEVFNKLTNKTPFSDGIGVADTGSISKVLLKVFVDSINVVDNFFTDYFQFFSRLFTDGIGMADTFGKKLDKLLTFVDNLSLSEIVAKVLPTKTFTDEVQASDSLTFAQTLSLIFTDTISAIDSIAKKTMTTLSEGIGLVDSGFIMPIKNFVDSISLSDSFVKSARIVLSSMIGLTDTLARKLNGMIINWEKSFIDVKDWTKRAIDVVVTSKVARLVGDWDKTSKDEEVFTKTSKDEDDWTKLRGEK